MALIWPQSLPQQFSNQGYSDNFADNRLSTNPELGPALVRSRISSMPRRVAGVMVMKKAQLDTLRTFWRTTTLDGKLPFEFPDPVFGYGYRRNWVPNSSTAGAVSGNPGTLPTGWGPIGVQNGISKKVAEVGVEGGLAYVDVNFSGSATGNAYIYFHNPSIVAASGEIWTQSLYCRYLSGDLSWVSGIYLLMQNNPVTINKLTDFKPLLTTAALNTQRYEHTWQPVATGMNGIWSYIYLGITPGHFIDVTLRISSPQMEKTKAATEYMATPNTANPLSRFAPDGRPPAPSFLGGNAWSVAMELELFETS